MLKIVWVPWVLALSAQEPQQKIDFVRDIQPVFEKSCYGCHGAKSQMGGLRLDAKDSAARTIHAGKPAAESSLYARVAGLGDQPRMPMGGKPLAPAQVDAIKRWIEQGADWPASASINAPDAPKHWAFVAPKRPAVPSMNAGANALDKFILARLEKEGLKPSPQADKTTLLRRLSLDLIGLPPTPSEVDAFLADSSPNAYQKQVERLLASPHYGERWGRHWLDAARYADSDGYEKDKQRFVWFYRDWVVNAFNRDLGYDQFLIEQLAGDQLPNATQDQKVATGFLRNSMINEEGGIDPEQFRMEAMFDRMDAISKGVLGLTVNCAQCHNHKYDPIAQEDYYKIFAFLNDSHEASIAVYTPEQQMLRADLFRRIKDAEEDLRHKHADWKSRMAAWEKSLPPQPAWTTLQFEVDDISTGGQRYLAMDDGSWLAQGYAPTKHKVKLTAKTTPDVRNIRAFRIELLNDPNLPLGGPGRSILGTGALTEFEAEVTRPGAKAAEKVQFIRASADIELPKQDLLPMYDDRSKKRRVTGPVEYAIDGRDETAWGHDAGPGLRNQPRHAVFLLDEPIVNEPGTVITVYLKQNHGGWNSDDNQNHNLGRFRVSVTGDERALADVIPVRVREILAIPAARRTEAQNHSIFSYWRTTVPEWKQSNDAIASLWKQMPEGSSQLTLEARDKSRETHLLMRGDFLKPGKTVQPGVPAILNSLPPNAPPTRLTFARWLTDRNAPTTARVAVNRVWQEYFGIGIVATSEDFGKQGDAPSHPELLDWLAVELMENKWSMKHLHRLIVNSDTYKQSSKVSQELLAKDPYNRLLARAPRLRVEGEIVRDIALASAGLLNEKIGGPPVYPPAPDFLFQPPASYGPKIWKEEKGADRYRRALYTHRYRSVPYPVLQNFDTPNGDAACPRRVRSNTPLQALTTLNEPLFFEAAQALGKKTLAEGGATDTDRIRYAFRRVLSRYPDANETAALTEFLNKQQKRQPATAWTALARVILNLDEAITKE
jgi:mono/diheme cytochrome c family protein